MNLGQLYISGISGPSLTKEESNFIKNEDLGGIILFSHNYESPKQLSSLVNEIQKSRGSDNALFISVDHEGGRVQRFKEEFTHFPSMQKLASLDSPKIVFEAHEIMAKELKACGINLSFSPVCDILLNEKNKVIGDRSFGEYPEVVQKMLSASLRGLKSQKLLACAKHFPGHGTTSEDSHYELPVVETDLETLREREFKCFYKAIRSKLDFMMVAHLVMKDIDPDLPCTLSKKVISILRNELKFNGFIVSDDFDMLAIADNYSIEDTTVLALNAGIDQLVFRSMERAQESLEALNSVHGNGAFAQGYLSDKVSRIKEFKSEFLPFEGDLQVQEIAQLFPFEEHANYLEALKLKL